jgi:hypothetical protein
MYWNLACDEVAIKDGLKYWQNKEQTGYYLKKSVSTTGEAKVFLQRAIYYVRKWPRENQIW